MSKKIVFVVASTLFLVTALVSAPLTFAQIFNSVQISAYGTNVIEDNLGAASLEFTVVVPPAGSEIPNSISAHNIASGENYTMNCSPGDSITMTFLNMQVDGIRVQPASEAYHFIISYEGEAGWLWVNGSDIPEFSPILIVPMFIAATLLALVYRRKRTLQIKQ